MVMSSAISAYRKNYTDKIICKLEAVFAVCSQNAGNVGA